MRETGAHPRTLYLDVSGVQRYIIYIEEYKILSRTKKVPIAPCGCKLGRLENIENTLLGYFRCTQIHNVEECKILSPN